MWASACATCTPGFGILAARNSSLTTIARRAPKPGTYFSLSLWSLPQSDVASQVEGRALPMSSASFGFCIQLSNDKPLSAFAFPVQAIKGQCPPSPPC